MMVGGPDEAVERLAPILDVLRRRRTAGGPLGRRRRRPLREDGPQRRRVRDDAGLRRGLRALAQVRVRARPNARIAELWKQGSVVRSWLCELAERAFEQEGNDLAGARAATSTTPARAAGRSSDAHRPRRADAGDHRRAVRALLLARATATSRRRCSPRCATSSAATRSRRRRSDDRDERSQRAENPLVEGLERLPVHPDDAGHLRRDRRPRAPQAAAGDLQPRPRGRAAGALQPDRRRRAARWPTTTSAQMARESIREFSRRAPDEQVLDGAARARRATCPAPSTTRTRLRAARREAIEELDDEGGAPLNRVFYLVDGARVLPDHRRALGEHGLSATTTSRCAW